MAHRTEQLYEAEAARIARWFSSDKDALVYYSRNGSAYPVIHAEQDRWLARGYAQARAYVAALERAPLLALGIGLPVFFLMQMLPPAWTGGMVISPVLGFGAIAVMIATVFAGIEWHYRRGLTKLRAEIERRTDGRMSEPAPTQRANAFAIILLLLAVPLAGWLIWSGADNPNALSRFTAGLLLALYPLLWLFSWLARRIDRRHIAITGRWWRNRD